MPYRLPPLSSLRLFEAAGRHLSFKEAAEELHVTPSAVSHGVKGLEDWLGVALFERGHRSLTLSEAGKDYLPKVRDALEQLSEATESVPGRRSVAQLSVSVAPTFGQRWLVPKLPDFSRQYPDIEISLDTSHRHVAFPRDGVDLAVRMGHGDWPDLTVTCLALEDLVPVAAPTLAKRIALPEDLANETLLHVTSVSEDWGAWAELAAADGLDVSRGLRFDTIDMALNAAAEGLGVAIGRLPLIAGDLAAGRLVKLLGPPRRCRTGYWLARGRTARDKPEVTLFCDWLQAELAL